MTVVAFGAFLVLFGNLLQLLVGGTALLPGGSWQFAVAGAVLGVLSLAAAKALGLDLASLGLRRAQAARGLAVGLLAGAAVATACVAATRLAPFVLGAPLVYGPVLGVSSDDLIRHVAVFLPLGVVIPEELAFRGTLLALFVRRWGTAAAITASALTFALWHVVVAIRTVADTTLGQS